MKNRRKRRMLRRRFLVLIAVLCLLCCSCDRVSGVPDTPEDGSTGGFVREDYHFLVLGQDRSGKLSDVIMLVSLNTVENAAAVVQIPRDTYANYTDRAYKKLNGAKAYLGIQEFRSFLETSLGIRIDRHVLLDLDVFSEIVDAIGGVPMTLPEDLKYDDPAQGLHIFLKKGFQQLNGDLAEQFVRYRSGYLQADLGRMDAQKLFLAAFINTVKENMTLPVAVQLIQTLYGKVQTDLTFTECCTLASVLLSADLSDVTLMTLAGEAIRTEAGTWYYVLSHDAAEHAMREFFGGDDFDPDGVFIDRNSMAMTRIYEKQSNCKIYHVDEIRENGLPIPMNP